MSRSKLTASAALLLAALPVVTHAAAPTVDGVLDSSVYGPYVALQGVQTAFGDNTPNPPGPYQTWADGSELDAAYAKISGGNLYLFFAGNVQSNYNKLELFFDTGAPGQNTIRRDNADVDFNALGRMGENLDGTNLAKNDNGRPATDPDQPSNKLGKGLTFDAGFNSTHFLTVTCGYDSNANDFRLFSNFATTPAAGGSTGFYVGSSDATNNRLINGANGIVVGSDNSNNAGVAGGDQAVTAGEHPELVTTGFEVKIPLSQLGNPTSPIKISAFINGGSHDFLSNQALGTLVPSPNFGNLGEPRTVDFSTLSGDQFFTVSLLLGDANGDGRIDGDDFALTDRGFNQHLTGWSNGDFNGVNGVDAADYQILDQAYLAQGGAPSPAFLAARANAFGDGYVSQILAAVPEPTSIATLATGLLLPLARRRR
jgi:hypothetical protein